MNKISVFKSPAQYACMLIDIAEESTTNRHGIAIDILNDAVAMYRLPQSYVNDVKVELDHWVITGERPA